MTATLQPALWTFVEVPAAEQPLTIQEQFLAFHAANSWVYDELVRLARELHARGRRHIGMKLLVENVRFSYYRQTTDPNSEFRVNNNYTSRYARLLCDEHPELAGLFELRKLKAA